LINLFDFRLGRRSGGELQQVALLQENQQLLLIFGRQGIGLTNHLGDLAGRQHRGAQRESLEEIHPKDARDLKQKRNVPDRFPFSERILEFPQGHALRTAEGVNLMIVSSPIPNPENRDDQKQDPQPGKRQDPRPVRGRGRNDELEILGESFEFRNVWRFVHSLSSLQVTSILRVYLFERFALGAPMLTTGEISEIVGQSDALTPENQKQLLVLLEQCDLLKFASQATAEPEIEQIYQNGRNFIHATVWRK